MMDLLELVDDVNAAHADWELFVKTSDKQSLTLARPCSRAHQALVEGLAERVKNAFRPIWGGLINRVELDDAMSE